MNEKISLTTIHSQNNNFGSVWQAFALSWFLEKNGYRPETLDYRPSYSNGLTSVKRIPTMLAGRLLHGLAVRTREKRFQSFISSRPLSRRYARYNEIKSCPPQADVYLIGSDQVWNPDYLCGNDPAYYLEFTDSNKKLAFSASAGKLLSQDEAGGLLRKTEGFCSISLREDLTAKQLNDAGREDAVHTLDPVFLLDGDEYRSLASSSYEAGVPKNGYILVYAINKDEVLEEVVRRAHDVTGKPVIQIGGLASKCASDYFPRDAGPKEFINLLDGADLMITSSFHGVAFSHILRKQFICLLPGGNHLRLESLMRDAGTSDRLARNVEDAVELIDKPIDFAFVYERLSPIVDFSRSYLLTSIEEVLD